MANHWEIVTLGGNGVVTDTPEGLWKSACMYFSWCDSNPIVSKSKVRVGKDAGKDVSTDVQRPYTIKGLCLHCNLVEEYIRDVRQSKDKKSLWYVVMSKILYIIYVQNEELATVGVFNPIFTAKRLNMETDDVPTGAIKIEITQGLPEISTSEIQILEKLEFEKGNYENVKRENS